MSTPWGPERWHAATEQLDGLLGLSAEERAARLDRLQRQDAALAADVRELLRDHEAARAGGFLEDEPHALLTATATAAGYTVSRAPIPPPMPPGTPFGPYRIVRVLGRGGMGVVYEAEERESGRRVALKVLQQRLGDARERERFEREGRLAASIDHEHCVYVFGATEVRGAPAIAMELMDGTLADRLAAGGRLEPGAAVDTVLQLIDGLQAAAEAGILHRDVKPSNCFVGADGVVKIGDFGISRSLRPTEETAISMHGQITGTPTYAPPEQLRGATLDVRADIYSLGATLYELVTGRRPFVADDLMSLLMAVANDPAEPPHLIRRSIPPDLSQVIMRCLAKRPEDRFQDYPALVRALEPHRSIAPTPATLGRRLAAGLIDQYAVGILTAPITLFMLLRAWREFDSTAFTAQVAATAIITFGYYGLAESLWRRTPGKALVGLTLVDTKGRPAPPAAGWARAALFAGAMALQGLALYQLWRPQASDLNTFNLWPSAIGGGLLALTLGILFCTVRRHNGYAALHDLATGTRLVERRALASVDRPRRTVPPAPPGAAEAMRGPFAVFEPGGDDPSGWRPGIDARLRRPVWIRDVPPGTPAVAPARAAVSRPSRLRWLAGRRTEHEAWDSFERWAGLPLPRACLSRPSWADARRWVTDLVQELAAQRAEDRPPLALDRVWVLEGGRAKLLDDPAVDATRPGGDGPALAFLGDVVRTLRAAHPEPWPLCAQEFADAVAAGRVTSIADAARRLEAINRRRAVVSRGLRRLSIAAVMIAPAVFAALGLAFVLIIFALGQRAPEPTRVAARILHVLDDAERGRRQLLPGDRERLEAMLASRYRSELTDPRFFHPLGFLMLDGSHEALAKRVLRRPADRSADGPLSASVQALLRHEARPFNWMDAFVGAVFALYGMLTFMAICAILLAPLTRGLVFRLLGLALVTGDGRLASRLRVLARTAVAWTPVLLPLLALAVFGKFGTEATRAWVVLAGLAAGAAGAIVALLRPSRGLQDRLAGTWVVPR